MTVLLLGVGIVLGGGGSGSVGTSPWELQVNAVGGDFLSWDGTARQEGRWDCGVAVAAMLLDAFEGDTARLAAAREVVRQRSRGLTMLEVRSLLTGGGLPVVGVNADVTTLGSLPLPSVVHVPGHFMVVDEVTSDSVTVRDPARGRLRLSAESFGKLWTGNALVVIPGR